MVFLISMVVAGSILASTAWRGSELVYRYGLGVMSLPKSEGDGHNHAHGGGHDYGDSTVQDMNDAHEKNAAGVHRHDTEMDFSGMNDAMDDDDHDHHH